MIRRETIHRFFIAAFFLFVASIIEGCSSPLRITEGDESLSFLEGEKKVGVRFDRSSISVGFEREHSFSEETFLKTRSKAWRKKWSAYRERYYEPRFDSLLNREFRKAGMDMKAGTDVKDADQWITIVVEHIYMGDLYQYQGPGNSEFGGGAFSYPVVKADLRIVHHRKGERNDPQAVFRYDEVIGKPFSVLVDLPVASFLNSIYKKTGRELGEQIVRNL